MSICKSPTGTHEKMLTTSDRDSESRDSSSKYTATAVTKDSKTMAVAR